MNIFLLGFMGAGKSTIGKKIAKKLGLVFYDLDELISEYAKCSINDIFKYLGEEKFREMEAICLRTFADKNGYVLATGGGTPCYFDNMNFIKKNGSSIYIRMDEKTLFDRLRQAKNVRPTIRNFEAEDLKQFIRQSLQTRNEYYEQANYTISGIDLDIAELVQLIQSTKKSD